MLTFKRYCELQNLPDEPPLLSEGRFTFKVQAVLAQAKINALARNIEKEKNPSRKLDLIAQQQKWASYLNAYILMGVSKDRSIVRKPKG